MRISYSCVRPVRPTVNEGPDPAKKVRSGGAARQRFGPPGRARRGAEEAEAEEDEEHRRGMLLCHRLATHGKDVVANRLFRAGLPFNEWSDRYPCLKLGNRRRRRSSAVSSAAAAAQADPEVEEWSNCSIGSSGRSVRDEMAGDGEAGTKSYAAVVATEPPADETSAQQNGLDKGSATDDEHGFSRAEFNSGTLVGSVSHYERHVFLCYKDPKTWPAAVEAADFDRLPRSLVAALRARKNDMPKTKLTVCEGRDGPDSSSGDVLIFPEMLRYRGLSHADVDSFVENVLVHGKEWTTSKPESLSGSHIFVCCHGSRDKRCGVCGTMLVEKIQEEIKLRGQEDQIFVRPCSHIGGHKFAGNLIVFGSTDTGTVAGHWLLDVLGNKSGLPDMPKYGYVAPPDVPVILDEHIGKGKVVDRLWRGQMGMSDADQKQALQDRLAQQDDSKKGCPCSEGATKADGKAQNGSVCCEAPAIEEKEKVPEPLQSNGSGNHDGQLVFLNDDSSTDEEASEPRIKLWGSRYITLPKWTTSWETKDTQAALAVVGAAAALTVAVHVYKRSS